MRSSDLTDLGVGDTVFVRFDHGAGFDIAITAVARKWATIGDWRFDRSTGAVDGGRHTSRGSVYRSKAAFEAEVALSKAWGAFKRELEWASPPPACTLEGIAAARELLGLPKEPPV